MVEGGQNPGEFGAYCTCLMLGVALLFVYNALLSTPQFLQNYFRYTQADPSAAPIHTNFWKSVMSYIAFLAPASNLVAQVVNFGSTSGSYHAKLFWTLILMGLFLSLIPLVAVAGLDLGEGTTIFFLITDIALGGLISGVYQLNCFSLVSNFPSPLINICAVGIAVGGVASNVIGILTMAVVPDTYEGQKASGELCLFLVAVFELVTAYALHRLQHNPFARLYVREYGAMPDDAQQEDATSADRSDPSAESEEEMVAPAKVGGEEGGGNDRQRQGAFQSSPAESDETVPHPPIRDDSKLAIFMAARPLFMAIFLTFSVSLIAMPSILLAIDTTSKWFPISIITLFNVTDTLGRKVTDHAQYRIHRDNVSKLAIGRFLFIPLFLMCVHTSSVTVHTFAFILCLLFGLTNGYVAAISMMYVPETPSFVTEQAKSTAGSISSLSLLIGCTVGSLAGLFVSYTL